MSLGIRDDTAKSDKLLENVETIRNLQIKGMISDCDYNINYILNKLYAMGIEVANINIQVEM